jgi:hypothetical protein
VTAETTIMSQALDNGAQLATQEGVGTKDSIPLPKRVGSPKSMMPATWVSRGVKLEYRDGSGEGQTLKGKLLDLYPAGPVVGANGARTLLSWDRLVLCELQDG